ncbi:hypothetical protein BDV38DRAFT_62798 [Aspergillus pseudotamarii]|uniref:Uncharacterized protein n=1 Tax=Aspergillus pseudotamarii TaxID=132259 RepID=A0A5N6TAJ8_ASPPS|nr:uncharacterized protein BDV38DRAFT_62798 [Aspergillus pseudotamarii]KAE8143199.1 hypothetical protein BDV38DRAFT_62798 [Aspergillus pseudotamarii]
MPSINLRLLHVHVSQALEILGEPQIDSLYGPSQESDKWAESTDQKSPLALEPNPRTLSAANEVVLVEFGGNLLSTSVPEILEDPCRLNIVAVIMVAESATVAIGMETKLFRISPSYTSMPYYVAGPTTTLRANRSGVKRETRCAGCYDLWSKNNSRASQSQRDASSASSQELTRKLLEHCGLGPVELLLGIMEMTFPSG